MKKYLKWAAVVIILLVIGSAVVSKPSSSTPKSTSTPVVEKQPKAVAPTQITADQLADDFDANQLAAEKKWEGKLVEFTEEVSNINEMGLSFYSVGSKEFSTTQISCRVEDKDSLLSLKNGEQATVRGVVGKQTIGVIEISNCEVVSNY